MRVLLALSRAIDWVSRLVGVFATYLVLLAAIFLPQLGGPDIIHPIMDPITRVIVNLVQAV
jgi:TRAP-type mannitol/chloroaromatic compound transport system permease small subunit